MIAEYNGVWASHCRQHDCAGALDLLRRASELARTNAGYAYVYAVALNSGRCVPDRQWHGAMNTFGFQLIQLIAELFPRPLSLAIWLS